MNRNLLYIHMLTASFFLPVAIMFAITGGLYTLEITGGYRDAPRQFAIEQPLTADLAPLLALAERQLAETGEDRPSGGASIRKVGTSFQLEWTGVNRDVLLKPTAEPLMAELVIRDTSLHRRFVQLHKAKGSALAKTISVAWAIGLLTILISGALVAWKAPGYRPLALRAGAAGLLTFLVYVLVG